MGDLENPKQSEFKYLENRYTIRGENYADFKIECQCGGNEKSVRIHVTCQCIMCRFRGSKFLDKLATYVELSHFRGVWESRQNTLTFSAN